MALLPLAIMGGAKLVGGLLKKKGQTKAAKEQYKKGEANEQAIFEERSADEANREDARLASVQGISEALAGSNRAISPAIMAAFMNRKKSAVRKRPVVDQSQGMGWGAASGVADMVGDMAASYIAGSNPSRNPNAVSGATRAMGQAPGASASGCPDYLASQGAC